MMILITLVLGAVIAAVAIFFFFAKAAAKKTSILITGMCDAGKTCLFSQLALGKFSQTFTSASENVGTLVLSDGGDPKTSFPLIDVPGHKQLRNRVDKFAKDAKAVIFVVDSVNLRTNVQDVAEYAYDLLTMPELSSVPFLFLLNKQDIVTATRLASAKDMLEREMNRLRKTQTASLESTDGSDSMSRFLGHENEDFKFEHLENNVSFQQFSARGLLKPGKTEREVDRKVIEEWVLSL